MLIHLDETCRHRIQLASFGSNVHFLQHSTDILEQESLLNREAYLCHIMRDWAVIISLIILFVCWCWIPVVPCWWLNTLGKPQATTVAYVKQGTQTTRNQKGFKVTRYITEKKYQWNKSNGKGQGTQASNMTSTTQTLVVPFPLLKFRH